MSLIKFDEAGNPIRPNLILAEVDYSPIGNLMVDDLRISLSTDNVIEASFTIYAKYRTDDGECLDNPYYEKVEGMRLLKIEDIGWFKISSPTLGTDGISEYKECVALSEETTFSKKTLDTLYINLGTDESAEWIYAREVYSKTDKEGNYTTTDEEVINLLSSPTSGIGYVQFYNENNPRLSLLHMLIAKNPVWSIGYVDKRLKKLVRQFEIDGEQDILSFIRNEVQTAYDCVFVFDSLNHEINVYHKDSIGNDTDIYMSFDTLLQKYNASYDIDDIITSYKVSGSEDFSIREVNGGSDTIINLDFYHTVDWMGKALYKRYAAYKNGRKSVEKKYSEIMSEVYVKLDEITDLRNKLFVDYDIDVDTVIAEKNSIGEIKNITNSSITGNTTLTNLISILRALTDGVIGENISDVQLLRTFFYLYDCNVDDLYYDDVHEYEEMSKKYNKGSTSMTKSIIKLQVVDKVIATMGKVHLDTLLALYKNLFDTRCVKQTDVNSKNNEADIDTKKTLLFNKRVTEIINSIETALTNKNSDISALEKEYNKLIQQSVDLTSPYTFENFFTKKEQEVLSQFIHEGYYSDTGFEVTDIMTVQEIFELKQELKNQADSDLLRKACPQISVSLEVCNIFELEDFKSLLNQMQLWNYIHAEVRDDYKVKLHLLGMDISYGSEPSLALTLGNIYHKTDPIKRNNDILNQVSTTSSSVSKTSSELSKYKTENKVVTTYINDLIENGLDLALTDIKSADNQSVEMDNYGIHLRKLIDGANPDVVGNGTEIYDPEQGWIVNNKFLFTSDNWETVRSLYGKFQVPDGNYYKGGEYFGVIAEMIIAGIVQGSLLIGNRIVAEGDVGAVIIDPNENGEGHVIFKKKETVEGEDVETILLNFNLKDGSFVLGKDVTLSWGDGEEGSTSEIIQYIENDINKSVSEDINKVSNSIASVEDGLQALKTNIGYNKLDTSTAIGDKYIISPNIYGGELKIVAEDNNGKMINSAQITPDGTFISTDGEKNTYLSYGGLTFNSIEEIWTENYGTPTIEIPTARILSTTMSGNGWTYEDSNGKRQYIYGLDLRVPILPTTNAYSDYTYGGNYISLGLYKKNYESWDDKDFVMAQTDDATGTGSADGSFLLIQGERGRIHFTASSLGQDGDTADKIEGNHSFVDFYFHDNAYFKKTAFFNGINSYEIKANTIDSNSAVNVTSDRNLKNTINTILTDKSKSLILNLTPSTFKYNNGTSDRLHWGFIAQDVEEVLEKNGIDTKDFAGYVYDKETDKRSLRYEEFIAPMVSVIQDQENRINELESDVETLKKKNKELENKLNMLLEKLG